MRTKILLIISVAYPAFLISIGIYGVFFVPTDVGYAPNPPETLFFQLTTLGSISAMILFVAIGIGYWVRNKNAKKSVMTIPFLISALIFLSLLSGILPKGANA